MTSKTQQHEAAQDAVQSAYWWFVDVTSWGSVFIAGSEELAEDFRAHKARWEGSSARKIRLRVVTAEEAAALEVLPASAWDRESGILTTNYDHAFGALHDHVPPDVVVLGYTPGSRDARSRGCVCPVADNANGVGRGSYGRKTWIRREDCPYHTGPETVPAPWKDLDDAP